MNVYLFWYHVGCTTIDLVSLVVLVSLLAAGLYRSECERPSGRFPNLWLSDSVLVSVLADFGTTWISLILYACRGRVPKSFRLFDFLFSAVWSFACLVPSLIEYQACATRNVGAGVGNWPRASDMVLCFRVHRGENRHECG